MSEPYVGEIKLFGGNFAPRGWAFCDGSLLPIIQNTALFSLIGTTYGGDGRTTFALPDLRGRAAMGMWGGGAGIPPKALGLQTGAETVALTAEQLPAHSHQLRVTSATGSAGDPKGQTFAGGGAYARTTDRALMHATFVNRAGSSRPHPNMQPFQAASYIISLFGVFPPRE